jgi:hypothetical protein
VTTATRAIERLAEATGTRQTACVRIARAMRESDTNLWPQGSQGHGKEPHIEPAHLVNLTLGVAVATPLIAAPSLVRGWRGLTLAPGSLLFQPERMGWAGALLFPDSIVQEGHTLAGGVFGGEGGLGGDLARLIELIATIEDESMLDRLDASGLSIEFAFDPLFPRATIRWRSPELASTGQGPVELLYAPRPNTRALPHGLDPAWNFLGPPSEAPISRTATVPFAVFRLLGDLWRDTIAHRAKEAAKQAAKEETASSARTELAGSQHPAGWNPTGCNPA